MSTNVIIANFRGVRQTVTDALWQWDYGQILRFSGITLPETFEVHFSNDNERGNAKTMIATDNEVLIPDEYLTTGRNIFVWIFLHVGEDDGETEYKAQIPVNRRAMPADDPPTPQEQSAITRAIAALNSAVVDVQEAVDAADSARASATSAASSATAAAASEAGVEADADRASNAATAAESAQTAAEAAQTGAETAQTGAESARDEAAQASVAQIAQINATGAAVLESIPADYTELSEDVSNLKSDILKTNDGLTPVEFTIVQNEYVENNGEFATSNGWNRSDYIKVNPRRYVFFQIGVTLTYCALYDANHEFISTFKTSDAIPLYIPSDAKYIVISGVADKINKAKAYMVGTLLDQFAQGNLVKNVFDNQYVSPSGEIKNYYNWSRTDYIPLGNIAVLRIESNVASTNNGFFDSDFNFVYAFRISTGENDIIVPPNASYVMLSGDTGYIESLKVRELSARTSKSADFVRSAITKNLNGKYSLLLDSSDLLIGKRIDGGDIVNDTAYAVTNSFYKIENTQNKYKVSCPEYGIYIHQYMEKADGSLEYLRRSAYITDGGLFWATTGCTHIRIEVYHGAFSPYYAYDFCNKFMLNEQNDVNKYIRICTFNQAADYPHFIRATEEDLNKRILNYLNFIGEYNPDVICAQEAVAIYFQPVAFEKSVASVFNRKYIYTLQSGYQRRMWSKYNYSDSKAVSFNVQAPDDSRFYGKATIHFEGKNIVVLNTHCAYQGKSDFNSYRKPQFEQLRDEMAQHEYCILCGDFNAWSTEEFAVFSDYNIANCGDYGEIDTWYVGTEYPDWSFKAFDNIITTKNINIQNVVRGTYNFDYFSDHAPLIADLQIL